MKRILFLFSLLTIAFMSMSNAQTPIKTYPAEWKRVDGFVQKNLPASALTEVKKIYVLAKKEKQEAQVIKTLSWIISLQTENREDNEVLAISEVEREIKESNGVPRAILQSLAAGLYWQYFQQNRYQLYRRTTVAGGEPLTKSTDIATWSAADLHRQIAALYLASIAESRQLQQEKFTAYEAIIARGNMRHLRPTLYDLLAQRALAYFTNDERDVEKPAFAFEIATASALDPAADFIHRKFGTADSSSMQYRALLIYQQLIAFHLEDPKPDALIDADLARIAFVYSKSVHPDKDQQYFNAINHIANQYGNTPAAAQAWYLVAAWQEKLANTYDPLRDTTQRLSRIRAKELLERIIAQKDSSEGRINAVNLLTSIQVPSLEFSVEAVNVPGQPFRSLVSYRNIGKLYLRVIRADESIRAMLRNQRDEKMWVAMTTAPAIRSWEQPLPNTQDLQTHSTEIAIDALPAGEYILLAGNSARPGDAETVVGARLFYVSSISYVSDGDDYFVLDRDSGKPLAQATVQLWKEQYDYKSSAYVRTKTRTVKTDGQGFVKILDPKTSGEARYNNNYLVDVSYGKDRLFVDEYLTNNYYYYDSETTGSNSEAEPQAFVFTDRGLYRPGQTIYFKAILVQKKKKDAGVIAGMKVKIMLNDANSQEIDSLSLTSNEFGSVNGKFVLPMSSITGSFSIGVGDLGTAGFRVEEYKRPKFEVSFEPVKGTFRVNDQLKITGTAKAYAGNNIDGATVVYRVVRQPRYLYSWMFRGWFPPASPQEIAHGEVKTGSDGRFEIAFQAIPDLSIDRKFDPAFDYNITADVTDINGETRSGQSSVSVSYKSLLLKTSIPASIEADSLKGLSIRAENNSGEFQATTIRVSITRLKEEQRLIRARLWAKPDQFVLNKEQYIALFPHDEYNQESDPSTWAKSANVFSKTDSVRSGELFSLDNQAFEPGYYLIEIMTNDKDGQEVKDLHYIRLYNTGVVSNAYLSSVPGMAIEPGQLSRVGIGSAAGDVFLVQQVTRSDADAGVRRNTYTYASLDHETKTFEFKATEADRGGYGVSWVFVKNNRVYTYRQSITVPWTNKQLAVSYASFRDKTLPGAQETWKIKISGSGNEQVFAEMLGSMYDASLDQFDPFSWSLPSLWESFYGYNQWSGSTNFKAVESQVRYLIRTPYQPLDKRYDELSLPIGDGGYGLYRRGGRMVMRSAMAGDIDKSVAAPMAAPGGTMDEESIQGYRNFKEKSETDSMVLLKVEEEYKFTTINHPLPGSNAPVQIRTNLNETAFFLPDLRTDKEGDIEFSFTMPEALTRWKFQAMTHTKDLAVGYSSKEIVTQKDLMVQPNPTRFLRQGDRMEFSAKIVNLSTTELTGTAELQLFDAATNEPVDGRFKNVIPNQYFTVAAGGSEAVMFPMEIPFLYDGALTWRIVAKAGNFSDGEENTLPVLTNRMLVTESLPLNMKGAGTRQFNFEKLLKADSSSTLTHQSLTVEFTSNPAWLAVQALPYLMEYPYDCAEQTWSKYYANSIAGMVANSSPRIKAVFDQWARGGEGAAANKDALVSNLLKNQELKALMAEETPWLLQAKSETEQKKNIAMLFDLVRMGNEQNSTIEKLKQMQSPNGGFVWFKGGPDDRYMTQHIVTGIGHLRKLKAISKAQDPKLQLILQQAIPYLDKKITEEYADLLKYKTDLKKYTASYSVIQYFYMRSFFPEYKIPASASKAYAYFLGRLGIDWQSNNKYMQGLIALALHRTGNKTIPAAILRSLKETSIVSEELGRYWKTNTRGWWWYEAPIERQALLVEAFQEIGNDVATADELRTWLIKNKQTNNWESTKATAEACYALLLQGSDWLSSQPTVNISLGDTTLSPRKENAEAGTGYFKERIEGAAVKSEMGRIGVSVEKTTQPSWGAVYWQYFEDLDKITMAATPLKLVKKLFVQTNSDRGPLLTPINDGDELKVGDKITVRIELRVDRDMEYVHMKDMRAAALEPVNVLSSYKYQGGLGYYESTRDASTNFFFSSLRKGTYVFEYNLFVTNTGNFSNGVTTIQCMYAPEFTAHSEGIRIDVEKP